VAVPTAGQRALVALVVAGLEQTTTRQAARVA